MAKETEHKYLVKDESYKNMAISSHVISQGYLSRDPERTVRVRVYGDKGFITVKGKNHGDTRLEFEYEIPLADACEMLTLCQPPVLKKIRYIVPYRGMKWEVDKFLEPGELTTAEIELPESNTAYALPPFAGRNVTGVPEFYNSNIDKLLADKR